MTPILPQHFFILRHQPALSVGNIRKNVRLNQPQREPIFRHPHELCPDLLLDLLLQSQPRRSRALFPVPFCAL